MTHGILLVNLGTPDAPTQKSIKKYLKEFLSDPRVVSLWRPLWWFLLRCVVLPLRTKRLAKSYGDIWLATGSPLAVYSQQQAQALQDQFIIERKNITVILAMRYGNPSIAAGLQAFKKLNIKKIIILPLYPQYSSTTTASVLDASLAEFKHWHELPDFRFINHFYSHPDYIEALAVQIETYWQHHSRGNKLLLSFHGLPEKLTQAGDPYAEQCYTTATLLAKRLHLHPEDYEVVFQSRFGLQKWLQPYCAERLKQLAQRGYKRVDVFCPGFVVDCLETLEEIAQTNKKLFLAAGGKEFHYIPALNTSKKFIHTLETLCFDNS